MRNTHILAGIVSAVILVASGIAHAGSCEGINARKYEKPIAVHKSNDKSVTYLLQSTGITSRKVAAGQAQYASYQTCSGLWTVNADKSGSGAGSCYTVDPDGDYRVTSWEGKKAAGKSAASGGTWARTAGTGKHVGDHMSEGTWTSVSRLAEGYQVTNWTGNCND